MDFNLDASLKITILAALAEGGYKGDILEEAKKCFEWVKESIPDEKKKDTKLSVVQPIN